MTIREEPEGIHTIFKAQYFIVFSECLPELAIAMKHIYFIQQQDLCLRDPVYAHGGAAYADVRVQATLVFPEFQLEHAFGAKFLSLSVYVRNYHLVGFLLIGLYMIGLELRPAKASGDGLLVDGLTGTVGWQYLGGSHRFVEDLFLHLHLGG